MERKKSNHLVLGIDLEGMNENLIENGVNLETDRVIEVGAVLWDFSKNTPLQIISELIDENDRLPISEEVRELTGIDDEMVNTWGLKGAQTVSFLKNLQAFMNKADYIMAHNGENYDIPMLDALFKRYELKMPKKIWIDTVRDIEYPNRIHLRNMASLEHAHGFINPFPHRAVTDVLSMLKIASQYSFERMVQLAESPRVKVIAKLNPPNWKKPDQVDEFNRIKNRVSKARFKWNPKNKTWSKEIHQLILDEGEVHFDFDWYIDQKLNQ